MSTLTDEEMDGASGGPLTDEQMDAVSSPKGNWYQAALNGLTFGLRPRIQAAIESRSLSGPEYEKVKRREWAEDDAYAKENPWTAFGLEMAGAVPTMFVPGLNAARIAQAANATGTIGRAGSGLSRGQRLARNLGFGSRVGSVGHEAGVLGAKSAALAGGLGSRSDTAEGRLGDAAMSAPVGYLFGRGAQAVGGRLAGVGEDVYDAARVGGDAKLGALTGLRRGLERDAVTPSDIRATMMPTMGRGTSSSMSALEDALISYGDALQAGASARTARTQAQQSYIGAMRNAGVNVKDKTLAEHVNRAINSWSGKSDIPLAIDELARLSGSSGDNLQWTRRAAQAAPNAGRSETASALHERQADILPTVREWIDNVAGRGNIAAATESLRNTHKAAENQIYKAARDAEMPFDLSQVLDEAYRTQPFRGGSGRQAVEDALSIMRGRPLADGSFERHTLDTYIASRGQLSDLIDSTMLQRPWGAQPTQATRFLADLKSKMDAVVERANPLWRTANDQTRGGRAIEEALEEAALINLNGSGRQTKQILHRVNKLRSEAAKLAKVPESARTPDQAARLDALEARLDAYRLGFSEVLHKSLDPLGDTHDLSKLFRKGGRSATSGVRHVINTMLGPDDAADFYQMIERANIASGTYRNLGGAQTTPLREAIDESKQDNRVAGMMRALRYATSPTQMFEDVGEMISNRLFENRNTELLRRYGVMTDRPADFLRLLREIDNFGAQRGGAFTGERLNAYSAPGVVGGAFGSSNALEDERKGAR